MNTLSKVCDAADWFDPEVLNIIQNELREPPRFHRKQWEFAMIFLALQQYGLLKADKTGLSMGGGKERVLYAIARHIRQLTVTDLYEEETSWDCAKTADPDRFIKSDKPFEVDDAKLRALRMDMRQLEFPDNTFDFCYSSCAVEHIGTYEDFLRHLNEVQRVLKEGGVYVFTTELHFGDETVEAPNNFIFSPGYLSNLIDTSKLLPDQQPDVSIASHRANFPLPSNFKDLCHRNENHFSRPLLEEVPHIQLLKGKYPFTSVLLILKKEQAAKGQNKMVFRGLEASQNFLQSGISEYRRRLQNSLVTINPFSALPNGVSRFFADHADFFSAPEKAPESDESVFHSDYFWLGAGERFFDIHLQITAINPYPPCVLELRIHRYATLNPREIETAAELRIAVNETGAINPQMTVLLDENYCYAVLAKVIAGECRFGNIEIAVSAKRQAVRGEPKKSKSWLAQILRRTSPA